MWPQLQKTLLEPLGSQNAPTSTSSSVKSFLLQPGGGAPSCLFKGSSQGMGQWVMGAGDGSWHVLQTPPPVTSSLQHFHNTVGS